MHLELFDSNGRRTENSLTTIVVDDLMVDPNSRVPEEISFVLKFSGIAKEWPRIIKIDDEFYQFNGQDAIPKDWADTYCGAATYVKINGPVFRMDHIIFDRSAIFTVDAAPLWLTSENTVPGSTMDNRWFWKDHVLTLNVGQTAHTDFHNITRIK